MAIPKSFDDQPPVNLPPSKYDRLYGLGRSASEFWERGDVLIDMPSTWMDFNGRFTGIEQWLAEQPEIADRYSGTRLMLDHQYCGFYLEPNAPLGEDQARYKLEMRLSNDALLRVRPHAHSIWSSDARHLLYGERLVWSDQGQVWQTTVNSLPPRGHVNHDPAATREEQLAMVPIDLYTAAEQFKWLAACLVRGRGSGVHFIKQDESFGQLLWDICNYVPHGKRWRRTPVAVVEVYALIQQAVRKDNPVLGHGLEALRGIRDLEARYNFMREWVVRRLHQSQQSA